MLNITQFQCVICKYLLLFSVLCDHKQNICCSGKTRLPKTSLRKRHWVFFIFVYRLCRSKTNCYTALSQIILVVFKVGKEPEPTHTKKYNHTAKWLDRATGSRNDHFYLEKRLFLERYKISVAPTQLAWW